MSRQQTKAVATLAGRAVSPRSRLVDEIDKQERFLTAYAEHGILTKALRASEITSADFNRWMTQDEVFATEMFQDARRAWADRIRGWVNEAAMEGIPEPVVYKGQIQYERDPDTGEIVRDARNRRVPVTVNKRDNRVLLRLAEANLDEFAKGRQGGDHTSRKGVAGGRNVHINFIPADGGRPAPMDVSAESVDYDFLE